MIDPRFRHLRILESQLKETTTQINKIKSELGDELHRLGVEVPENLSFYDNWDSVLSDTPRVIDSLFSNMHRLRSTYAVHSHALALQYQMAQLLRELERRHENLIGISAYPDDYRLIVRLDGIRHELPLYDVWDYDDLDNMINERKEVGRC